jgi:intracellular multiplication protein IcmT
MLRMWRNTQLPVRIFVADARALIPVLVFILHWSWWTFYVAIVGCIVFAVLEWLGLTYPAAVRLLRRLIIGPVRPAVPSWKKRRLA